MELIPGLLKDYKFGLRVMSDIENREPTESVQHFVGYISDMVWLHRSSIPVGRRGAFYLFKLFLPAFAALRGRGGGGEPAPCWVHMMGEL